MPEVLIIELICFVASIKARGSEDGQEAWHRRVQKLGVFCWWTSSTKRAQYTASIEEKMQRGNRQSWRNFVMTHDLGKEDRVMGQRSSDDIITSSTIGSSSSSMSPEPRRLRDAQGLFPFASSGRFGLLAPDGGPPTADPTDDRHGVIVSSSLQGVPVGDEGQPAVLSLQGHLKRHESLQEVIEESTKLVYKLIKKLGAGDVYAVEDGELIVAEIVVGGRAGLQDRLSQAKGRHHQEIGILDLHALILLCCVLVCVDSAPSPVSHRNSFRLTRSSRTRVQQLLKKYNEQLLGNRQFEDRSRQLKGLPVLSTDFDSWMKLTDWERLSAAFRDMQAYWNKLEWKREELERKDKEESATSTLTQSIKYIQLDLRDLMTHMSYMNSSWTKPTSTRVETPLDPETKTDWHRGVEGYIILRDLDLYLTKLDPPAILHDHVSHVQHPKNGDDAFVLLFNQ
ncbi:hypothetical protein INR49_015629, partial [Caranx melampygus]